MRKTLFAVCAVAVLALSGTGSAYAAADPAAGATGTATVTITGMTFVPDGVELTSPPKPKSETLTVVAPVDDLAATVKQRVKEASLRINATSKPGGAGSTINRTSTKVGGCGTSYVTLNGTSSQTQGQGYVEAGFTLIGVSTTGAYVTDTMVFSESSLDGWTAHLHDEGNLRNWTSWSKGTRVDINKTQEFGAHFYVGTVRVTIGSQTGTCYTTGPRVDDVPLYRS